MAGSESKNEKDLARTEESKKVKGKTETKQQDETSNDRLSQLPIVVLDNIIQNLDPKSILALRATNEILAKAVESNAERLLKRYLVALKTTCSSVTRLLALMSHAQLNPLAQNRRSLPPYLIRLLAISG